ncbi:MAG: hypothetical protein LBT74_12070 [Acidobacteriota bacterium]|jgi:16S rRNA (cytosine967-C5)-methyltransferase|nr:hypothetical protein [Acidobacteriota bacterium]
MPAPARQLTFDLLGRIESRRLHSDDAVNSPEMARLDPRDRNLTTELVYGVLRHRATLDWLIKAHSSRPWQATEAGARIVLRMALYQFWKMDRIPDHALVNDAVELAKRRIGPGVAGYVNGVLRRLARLRPWDKDGWLAGAPEHVALSLPPWLWTRWRKRFGGRRAREFALSLLSPPPVAFRCDGASGGEAPSFAGFRESEVVPGAYLPDGAGEGAPPPDAYFQDEASQLIPFLGGAPPAGGAVWDACAAPGGKAAILAGIAGAGTVLVASDLDLRRAGRLREVLRRARAGCAVAPTVAVADARETPPFRALFDLVCADVPCSGLGTLRRNPEIKWRIQPEDLGALHETQRRILQSVAGAVRPGGRLLYSTCSTEPEENERVVEGFLREHGGFRVEAPVQPAGVGLWTGDDGMVRTFPGTRPWDGFFAALLVKV